MAWHGTWKKSTNAISGALLFVYLLNFHSLESSAAAAAAAAAASPAAEHVKIELNCHDHPRKKGGSEEEAYARGV